MTNNRAIILIVSLCFGAAASLLWTSHSHPGPVLRKLQVYEDLSRDLLIQLRYNLRLSTGTLECSRQVTVIGLDDPTINTYGKTDADQWILRVPYGQQLRVLQQHFPPSVLAYDIIFKHSRGGEAEETDTLSSDMEGITQLGESLKAYGKDATPPPLQDLLRLIGFVSEQGELLFAESLSEVAYAQAGSGLSVIPVIGAFHYVEPESLGLNGTPKDPAGYFRWSRAEALGTDPQHPDPATSTAYSYLSENSIPAAQVSGLPPDYPWMPHAQMVSLAFRDVMKQAFVNARRDDDGVVRRIPMILATRFPDGKGGWTPVFSPSLALSAVLQHLKVKPAEVHVEMGKAIHFQAQGRTYHIPINEHGYLLVNWSGKARDFQYIPFYLVNYYGSLLTSGHDLQTLSPQERQNLETVRNSLKGNIAFVGVTHTGQADTGPTSLDPMTALVYAHVNAADSILRQSFITPAQPVAVLGLLLTLALLSWWANIRLPPLRTLAFHAMLALLLMTSAFLLVHLSIASIPVLLPLAFISASALACVAWRYLAEEREKLKVRRMFATMVSPEVLKHMEENPESFSLSGQRTEASIMFSDVAGFTTISEALGPDKLVALLNRYLTPMTDIIMASDGYLDKYAGDGIMAEWGVPSPDPEHAVKACLACLDQQAHLSAIREELFQEFGYRLVTRMGINTGIVSAGNMGSAKHFSYTVMGDAVNLAARLEPTNKDYDTLIIIGHRTWELAKHAIEARFLDFIVVKGKTEPIRIYELLSRKGGIDSRTDQALRLYEKGFELHLQRDWTAATASFQAALELRPEDGPSKAMIERVSHYQDEPPPAQWLGEYVRKKKD